MDLGTGAGQDLGNLSWVATTTGTDTWLQDTETDFNSGTLDANTTVTNTGAPAVVELILPATSGVYTSSIKALGSITPYDTIDWAAGGTGTVAMKVRSCDDAACSSAGTVDESDYVTNPNKEFAAITAVNSGVLLTASSGVTAGDGWIQYEATLTGDGSTTPTLDSVTVTTASLVIDMRAGPDDSDCPGACTGWTAWTNVGTGATSSADLGMTFDNYRYLQYKLSLSTVDTAYSPSLDSLTIGYASGDTQEETIEPGPVDEANSTVGPATASVTADGTTQLITVTVQDQFGNAVDGKLVSLSSSRGATDTIEAVSDTTDILKQHE